MITSIPREISDPGLITKHFQYTHFLLCLLWSQVKSSPYLWLVSQGNPLAILYANTCTSPLSSPSLWLSSFAPFTSEAYPSCTVTDIRLCFDVHKLMRLDLERYLNCCRLKQHSLWSVRGSCLTMLCFAGARQWKAGCILPQRPKRRGRSWLRPTHAPRYCAATSVVLKRYLLISKTGIDRWLHSCAAQKVCYHWMALQSKSR